MQFNVKTSVFLVYSVVKLKIIGKTSNLAISYVRFLGTVYNTPAEVRILFKVYYAKTLSTSVR